MILSAKLECQSARVRARQSKLRAAGRATASGLGSSARRSLFMLSAPPGTPPDRGPPLPPGPRRGRVVGLEAGRPASHGVAVTSNRPAAQQDIVLLAEPVAVLDRDLVLLPAPRGLLEDGRLEGETATILASATCDVAILARGAGTGNAVWACDSKTGDCTDYHSVFIGVCRWRGIPADHVFGMPIPPEKTEGEIKFCHCWAQFWVAGIGWIPIDASRADKFPADRDYYFGTIGSTWVTLAHGRDVVLEPPQQGPPINMFHEPIAEADGDGYAIRSGIVVVPKDATVPAGTVV